jgi:predicted phosphodiesterase
LRYLILSDIHGNRQALEAVARAAEGQYGRMLCCGDLVGYGADPNAVVDWIRAHCSEIVRGNHDRACTGQEDLSWFNPVARAAALWTQAALTVENAAFVRALPRGPLALDGFQLAHGSLFDEDEYVSDPEEAAGNFASLEGSLVFFGHTHIQGGYRWTRGRPAAIPGAPGPTGRRTMEIDSACAYLVNPGSVGQPRDDDPRAAFAIYDSEAHTVVYRRVSYDVSEAQRRIGDAGLPWILAERLSTGR